MKTGLAGAFRGHSDFDGIVTEANVRRKGIPMKFGYTIVYVLNVAASLVFFARAFGIKRRFLHESGEYGELETGETVIGFSRHNLAERRRNLD